MSKYYVSMRMSDYEAKVSLIIFRADTAIASITATNEEFADFVQLQRLIHQMRVCNALIISLDEPTFVACAGEALYGRITAAIMCGLHRK